MNAILLATDTQTEPLQTQFTRLRAYCSALGWMILAEFKAPEDAVRRCKTLSGAVLLMTRLERIGPLPASLGLLEGVLRHGCHVASVEDHIDTTTPAGRASLETLIATADRLTPPAPKATPRVRHKASKNVPYGYRFNGSKLVEHPDEQAVLEKIREMRNQGESLRGICRRLDEAKIRRRGKRWRNSHSWVRRLIQRED